MLEAMMDVYTFLVNSTHTNRGMLLNVHEAGGMLPHISSLTRLCFVSVNVFPFCAAFNAKTTLLLVLLDFIKNMELQKHKPSHSFAYFAPPFPAAEVQHEGSAGSEPPGGAGYTPWTRPSAE